MVFMRAGEIVPRQAFCKEMEGFSGNFKVVTMDWWSLMSTLGNTVARPKGLMQSWPFT
tara:strand:+ start:277 stop:450 length:174 start_codon:yes stop_codon:yes gene_type:complete